MRDEQFVVDYPNESEIRQQITAIVDKGLPKKKTFIEFLLEMHQQLGWRHIFRDYQELTLIGVLFILYSAAFILIFKDGYIQRIDTLYSYLFIASPLLYGALSIFSLVDKQKVIEVEMSCKYNVYQVAAYRMLFFAFISILANISQILITTAFWQEFNPVIAIMISLTSLLVFALGFLYATKRNASKFKQLTIIGAWLFLNIGMALWSEHIYNLILLKIPFPIYGLVIATGGFLFIRAIKNFAYQKTESFTNQKI